MTFVMSYTYFYKANHLMNYMVFFVNGLPGGIDYVLLVLVYYGIIEKNKEKEWNAYVNVWIRSPFIAIGTYIIFINYRLNFYNPDDGVFNMMGFSFITEMMALFWNGQYFMYRVVKNYGECTKKRD